MDLVIRNGDFYDWLNKFIELENDRQLMDVWLNKVFDQSFVDFKKSILGYSTEQYSEITVETVIESKNILNKFIPEGGA